MLYLHCGWPRTSTTTLQTALLARKDSLVADGFVYPEGWMAGGSPTHFGLSELLTESLESAHALDDLKAFLSANADRDMLFSNENFTKWLVVGEKREALLSFLRATRSVVPTKCIWTLRRFDEVAQSIYLRGLARRAQPISPRRAFERILYLDALFEGMQLVEEAVENDVVYVKYHASGIHNEALLRAFAVPTRAAAEISAELRASPRLNRSLSHKAAVVLANVDAISAKAEVDFDEAALRASFRRGDFSFTADWPCELVGPDTKKVVHERALTAARSGGVNSYVEFFAGDEIRCGSPVGLGPEILTDLDLLQMAERRDFVAGVPDLS